MLHMKLQQSMTRNINKRKRITQLEDINNEIELHRKRSMKRQRGKLKKNKTKERQGSDKARIRSEQDTTRQEQCEHTRGDKGKKCEDKRRTSENKTN